MVLGSKFETLNANIQNYLKGITFVIGIHSDSKSDLRCQFISATNAVMAQGCFLGGSPHLNITPAITGNMMVQTCIDACQNESAPYAAVSVSVIVHTTDSTSNDTLS